jgi:hypothetical protein
MYADACYVICLHDTRIVRHCYSAACLVWELGRWTLGQTLLFIINSTLPEIEYNVSVGVRECITGHEHTIVIIS